MTPLRLVFLGPPGSGKGTQAQILERRYGVVQISTGDILRRHRAEKTALGMQAQGYIDRGEYVPDDIVIGIIENEIPREGGFGLDGFPRTIAQAQALDGLLGQLGIPLTAAVLFEVPRSELVRRLSARWTNPRTSRVYNEVSDPPLTPGIDDEDGGPLIRREDDEPATVERRLQVYEEQTTPLIGFYERAGALLRIDATRPVADVTDALLHALEKRDGRAA